MKFTVHLVRPLIVIFYGKSIRQEEDRGKEKSGAENIPVSLYTGIKGKFFGQWRRGRRVRCFPVHTLCRQGLSPEFVNPVNNVPSTTVDYSHKL